MRRIYFDHNATSPLNTEVKNEMIKIMSKPLNASSIHQEGRNAKNIIDITKTCIQETLSLNNSYKIVFTGSCTEANNIVIQNFMDYEKICSHIDHISIRHLNKKTFISITQDGLINTNNLQSLLKEKRKYLVSVTYANNEIGTIQPINKIAKIIKNTSNILHCDISQAIGKINIDVKNIDIITMGCHKFGGPTGIGCLIYKNRFDIQPIIYGGQQEYGIRPGTENIISIKGLHYSFQILEKIKKEFAKTKKKRDFIEESITKYTNRNVIIAKKTERLPNTSYIHMPNVPHDTQIIFFDLNNIAVSAGSACSSGKISQSLLLKNMGFDEKTSNECIRISIGPNITQKDIDQFIYLWKELFARHN